jgi:hypothetical protein
MDQARKNINQSMSWFYENTYSVDDTTEESMWEFYVMEQHHLNRIVDKDFENMFIETEEEEEEEEEKTWEEIYNESIENMELNTKIVESKNKDNNRVYNEQWVPGKNWFHAVNNELSRYNTENLKNCHRPIKMNFLDYAVDVMTKMDREYYERNKKKDFLDDEIIDLIDKIVERYDMEIHESNPYEIFGHPPLSIPWSVIDDLKEAELLYTFETTPSKVETTLKYIMRNYYSSYQIINYYFKILSKKKSIICYKLPLQVLKRQVRTEHRLYETLPGEKLPDCAGLYYICMNCGEFKSHIYNYGFKNTKVQKCSYYSKGICVDCITRDFTCVKNPLKNNTKKRSNSDMIGDVIPNESNNLKEAKKKAKYDIRNVLLQKCTNTVLDKVNLMGTMLQTPDGLILKCPECGILMYYDRFCFEGSGKRFSCGCYQTKIGFYEKKNVSCCIICKKKADNPVQRYIYDDIKDFRIKTFFFCKDHTYRFIDKWNQFPTLSLLNRIINEGEHPIRLESGEIITVRSFLNKDIGKNYVKKKVDLTV